MTESSGRTDREHIDARLHHERSSAASAPQFGPTADRYHDAMVHYLSAISGGIGHDQPGAARRRAPATVVGDVMTRAVVAVHADLAFKEIIASLARNRVSAVPVIDDEHRVVGVVSEGDLMAHIVVDGDGYSRGRHVPHAAALKRKAHAATAAELMTTPAITTRPHASIVEAAQTAAQAGVRHLPVVDGDGHLVGIISRSDLLRVFLRDDADIRDEIERYAAQSMRIGRTALTVDVTDGVVTLAGKLDRTLQVAKLVRHVRDVSGVVAVNDTLTARFDDRFFPAPREAR